ncbi:MAG TPA: hypothetical protein VMW83_09905 [Spirochaetia bacterium]|nr:hypothetical protein [Spirochaetia bacterium]
MPETTKPKRLQTVLNQMEHLAQVISCRTGEWQIDLEPQALAPVAFHLAESLAGNLAAFFLAPAEGEDRFLHAVLPAVEEKAYL